MTRKRLNIAIIGFGEAGAAIASGLQRPNITAYDVKLDDATNSMAQQIVACDASTAHNIADLMIGADVVFSVVTADQAFEAAQAAALHIETGALFFDCNSCAPSTKVRSASVINDAGGRYVDVAIMAPIHPRAHKTPMLVASSAAEDAIACMTNLGMDATLVGKTVGRASTIKMLRSVMVKGIEALTAECFRAACRAGVAQDVAASLDASQSQLGWADQTAYNLERMTTHGLRRAAEMREVTKTLQDLGVASEMTNGTVNWQQSMGDLNILLDDVGGLHDRMATIEESDSNQNGN